MTHVRMGRMPICVYLRKFELYIFLTCVKIVVPNLTHFFSHYSQKFPKIGLQMKNMPEVQTMMFHKCI